MKKRCRWLTLFASVLTMIVVVGISPSNAALVTWNLSHVKFGPGGFDTITWATGWFVYDTSRMIIVDWRITSPDHFVPCCRHYDIVWTPTAVESTADVVPDAAPGGGAMAFYFFQEISSPTYLLLTTARPLTDAGGTVPLLLNFSTAHWYSDPDHQIISGMLVAVPEPSEAFLLGVGLVALAGFSVRRSWH